MYNMQLLDCTLRDGGYVNEWKFGHREIKGIISRLVESQVEYVELGFLRDCDYDCNYSLFNNISEIKNILPDNVGNTKFTVMALHNKYNIDKLENNDGKTIYAIRVTFHDYDIDEGLDFVERVMQKGYKCFCNPINIMGYTDKHILEMIEKINKIKPYSFSIVDTFGSMMMNDFIRIYSVVDNNLDSNIKIGLHLHENLSMSFALAQKFIEICPYSRQGIIDGSLFGMGRAPGNLCIELIMDYMIKHRNCNYNLNSALDAIDDYIMPIKEKEAWGYSVAYSLSAKYNLHRNYAEFLLEKGKLRAKQINQILADICENKKIIYDEEYIEKLYCDFKNIEVDDSYARSELMSILNERPILIIAPGLTLTNYEKDINEFIKSENPIVIATNFDGYIFKPNYYFFTNLRRFDDYWKSDFAESTIVTSNLIRSGRNPEYIVNYNELAFDKVGVFDNSVIMLLRLFCSLSITSTSIAGFDGFKDSEINYIEGNLEHYVHSYSGVNSEENKRIHDSLSELRKLISIDFITPSLYEYKDDNRL